MDWPYRYAPYIWPMLISAAQSSALAVYAWRRCTIPGATPFAMMLLSAIFWALAAAMELAAKIFWFKV